MTIDKLYSVIDIWAEIEIRCAGNLLYHGKCAHIPKEIRDFEIIYLNADIEALIPLLRIKVKPTP
jgi:hypothetical protein